MPPLSTDGSPVWVSLRPMMSFIAPTTTFRMTNDVKASTTGRQVRWRRARTPATTSRIGSSTERWPNLS